MNGYNTYTGDNLQEALLQVKMDLGEDAKIADTREVNNGFLGIFGDSVVEVDAWLPETSVQEEAGSSLGAASNDSSPRGRQSSGDESSGREWVLDDESKPEFSKRDQATRMIEEKNNEENLGGEETYSRNDAADGGDFGSSEKSTGDNGSSDDSLDRELIQKLDEIDLIHEKIDALAEKVESDSETEESSEPEYPGELSGMYARLIDQGVKRKLARRMIGRLRRLLEPHEIDQPGVIRARAKELIEEDFDPVSSINVGESPVIVPFVGPTGVGKTTTLAKLSARKLLEDREVGFISHDIYRLAAVDQLRCYADILGVPILDIEDYDGFSDAVSQLEQQGVELIFVDTAGHSQFDDEKLNNLKGVFETDYDYESHLVLSATSRQNEVESVLENFDRVGYDRIVVTKLDETKSYGMIYNLVRETDAPVSYFTDGQDVPNDIMLAEPDLLGDYLLEGEK